jgi:hypothetical protein
MTFMFIPFQLERVLYHQITAIKVKVVINNLIKLCFIYSRRINEMLMFSRKLLSDYQQKEDFADKYGPNLIGHFKE